MYRFPFAGRYVLRLSGCIDFKILTAGGSFDFFSCTKRHRILTCFSPRHPTSDTPPKGNLVYNTVLAIYQIMLGRKTCKYYYETDEFPNPRPTQPKKN